MSPWSTAHKEWLEQTGSTHYFEPRLDWCEGCAFFMRTADVYAVRQEDWPSDDPTTLRLCETCRREKRYGGWIVWPAPIAR